MTQSRKWDGWALDVGDNIWRHLNGYATGLLGLAPAYARLLLQPSEYEKLWHVDAAIERAWKP